MLSATFLLCSQTLISYAQKDLIDSEKGSPSDTAKAFTLNEYAKPTIELQPGRAAALYEAQRKAKLAKKKIRKRNVFYGKKSKKRMIVTRKGKNVTFEVFYVAKAFERPTEYAYEKTYFDARERKLVPTSEITNKYGHPLHGTYLRIVNGDTVSRRIYYMGTRHGRWEEYDKYGTLQDKAYYFRGHPKKSEVQWYDANQTKLKEVIPIQHGEKNGIYMRYYPSGRVQEVGKYEHNQKVGIWTEYYDRGGSRNRKLQTRYQNRAYKGGEPKVIRKWDRHGKQVDVGTN